MGDPESVQFISDYAIGIILEEGIRRLANLSPTLGRELSRQTRGVSIEQRTRTLTTLLNEYERSISSAHGEPFSQIRREASVIRVVNMMRGLGQELSIALARADLDERFRSGEQVDVTNLVSPLGKRVLENFLDSTLNDFDRFASFRNLADDVRNNLRAEITRAIRRTSENNEGTLADLLSSQNQRSMIEQIGNLISSYVEGNERVVRLVRDYFTYQNSSDSWPGANLTSRTADSLGFLARAPHLVQFVLWQESVAHTHPNWQAQNIDRIARLISRYSEMHGVERANNVVVEINRMQSADHAIAHLENLVINRRIARL